MIVLWGWVLYNILLKTVCGQHNLTYDCTPQIHLSLWITYKSSSLFFLVVIFIWQNCDCSASFSADDYYIRRSRCIYSSPDFSDMVYIDSFYLNKFLFTQFNSTLRKFVGFSEIGMRVAEGWNNSPFLLTERAGVTVCKFIFKTEDTPDLIKVGKWLKTIQYKKFFLYKHLCYFYMSIY